MTRPISTESPGRAFHREDLFLSRRGPAAERRPEYLRIFRSGEHSSQGTPARAAIDVCSAGGSAPGRPGKAVSFDGGSGAGAVHQDCMRTFSLTRISAPGQPGKAVSFDGGSGAGDGPSRLYANLFPDEDFGAGTAGQHRILLRGTIFGNKNFLIEYNWPCIEDKTVIFYKSRAGIRAQQQSLESLMSGGCAALSAEGVSRSSRAGDLSGKRTEGLTAPRPLLSADGRAEEK